MVGIDPIAIEKAPGEATETPSPGSNLVPAAGWVALAIMTVVWSRVTQDAWRLRSIVADYVSVHGGYDIHANPWPDHLMAFHDGTRAVGADYFYPFAWGMLLAIGLIWAATGLIATIGRRHWRPYLIGAGGVVLVAQLALLGPALVTYINVTD